MVSHKCCICGKQNKKSLRSLFNNCEIVGKNTGDFLCMNHKEQLGDFLDEIGVQDEFIRVRYDKKYSKFFLVPSSSSPPLSSLCHNSSLKNPGVPSAEQTFACNKSLLSTFSRKLSCTVCGEHRLEILPATFEIEPVSTVQLECRHCSYVLALSESMPDLQIISVPSSSFSSSTPASSQGASPAQDDDDDDDDDVSDSSASSQGSVSPFAVEDNNDNENDNDAISPQQAASALLSLDRVPSSASIPEKTESQTKSFQYSKHVDFQMVSPRITSAVKRTQTSMSTRTSTSTSSMNGRISINCSSTTTTSSSSSSSVSSARSGMKRMRAEDHDDVKLQEARAQAPKKRRLVESYTNINPIKAQQSSSTQHHNKTVAAPPRLPSVVQSFPMERLPTFEDLAVTLQTIVPYGLDHGQ